MNAVMQRSCLVAGRRGLAATLTRRAAVAALQTASYSNPTARCQLAIKAGSVIPGLDFIKDKEPVLALERSEYPEWVASLAVPPLSLAKLRRMPEEEATDRDKERFLKLTRRQKMKKNNEEAGA